jgi:short-subunit dehydrogenase
MAFEGKVIAVTGASDGIGAGPARNQQQQPH